MTQNIDQIVEIDGSRSGARLAKILASGCINGPRIRFNQTNLEVSSPIWDQWKAEGRLVQFCAELAVGFPIPRPPAEIVGGDSVGVAMGCAQVLEDNGNDVTELFLEGARRALKYAQKNGCVAAVLTDGSPSCGSSYVYDGSFGGGTRPGTGVVAQMLLDHGIRVFSEEQLEQADRFVRSL